MANIRNIRRQLRAAGFRNRFWGWSAINQLPGILEEDEQIEQIVSGLYEGGHAVLLATNLRLLFLDKKVMSFGVEDIPYDMISEVEYHLNPLNAKLNIHCRSKDIELTSLAHSRVTAFAIYVEHRVSEIRDSYAAWNMSHNQTMPATPQVRADYRHGQQLY